MTRSHIDATSTPIKARPKMWQIAREKWWSLQKYSMIRVRSSWSRSSTLSPCLFWTCSGSWQTRSGIKLSQEWGRNAIIVYASWKHRGEIFMVIIIAQNSWVILVTLLPLWSLYAHDVLQAWYEWQKSTDIIVQFF